MKLNKWTIKCKSTIIRYISSFFDNSFVGYLC